jgi:hypothetical protein
MLDKTVLRKQIMKALLPVQGINYEKKFWPKWVEDRLTTLAIYSYTDKNKCNHQYIECLKYRSKGYDYEAIALDMNLKKDTVKKYIRLALDWIIENTPDNLLVNIPITRDRLRGCPHCTGTLMWDDSEGNYWCINCSRLFDENNIDITKNIGLALLKG